MEITGKTKLVGVTGWPLTYTFSPSMHNPAIQKAGLDYIYAAFPLHPDDLEVGLRGLFVAGVRGLNVTIPHKERVAAMMDTLSQEAQAVGAVNTVRVDDDGLCGFNTDVYGFSTALGEAGFSLEGRRVAIAGAGGVGRAIVTAALLGGASSVAIWDIDAPRCLRLVNDFQKTKLPHYRVVACAAGAERENALARCHLFVTASPVGVKPSDPSPIDVQLLPHDCFVFDSVYNVDETTLLARARDRGLAHLNGLTMLMHQGAKSFEIWFGVKPDTDLMLQKLRQRAVA